jgi:methylated-DNA-[protein]-cysteine S-methyltransferase
MPMESEVVINTPILKGSIKLGIRIKNNVLCGIEFLPDAVISKKPKNNFVNDIVDQILRYFEEPDLEFTFNFELRGTDFQRCVWEELRSIRIGTTASYGFIARRLITSPRAVGGACRQNPIPLVVPCHRVVAARGIGGFSGHSVGVNIDVKRWLLEHETKRHGSK